MQFFHTVDCVIFNNNFQFTKNVEIATYFIYYRYVNGDKEVVAIYDYVY